MQTETVVVMIVGIVALATVRVIVMFVGREHAADHEARAAAPGDVVPRQVRRGTGRNSHLVYFSEPDLPAVLPGEPVPAALPPFPQAS